MICTFEKKNALFVFIQPIWLNDSGKFMEIL